MTDLKPEAPHRPRVSLLEVVILIAILAVLVAITIPVYGALRTKAIEDWAVQYVETGDAKNATVMSESNTGSNTELCIETMARSSKTYWEISVSNGVADAERVDSCPAR